MWRFWLGLVFVGVAFGGGASAQELGHDDFMRGAPPDSARLVTKANWFVGPFNRWGLQHVREIVATTEISRGAGPVWRLPEGLRAVEDIPLTKLDGSAGTVGDWIAASYTDGFLVLHEGSVAAEVYLNSMTPRSYHNFFSMSKSFTGCLTGIFAARGVIDPGLTMAEYVPELAGSAYGDATVRHVWDMSVGIRYVEDYDDPESDVYRYSVGANSLPNPKGLALYDVLPTFPKAGEHGAKFHYVTANTDALGWAVQRATGRKLAEVLETEIWAKLGAERDAYVITDLNGTAWLGGGLNATLRDAGRFGLMMLNGGKVGDEQVVPKGYVEDLIPSAIETGWPNLSYRSQWWIYPHLKGFAAQGVAGQRIIVLPEQDLVIVKFSSWPTLSEYHPDGRDYDARAIAAIVEYFSR